MIAFGFALLLAGIIMLICALAQYGQIRSYAAGSESVVGAVTYKRSRQRKNGISYELTVAYTVNGVAYKRDVGAGVREWDAIAVGQPLKLIYKLDDPKKAVRPAALNPQNARIILIIGVVLTVAGVVIFMIGNM